MCTDHGSTTPVVLPEPADWHGEVIGLEPVDDVVITTVCDNSYDMLLTPVGPAVRTNLARPTVTRIDAATIDGGTTVDLPVAEAGFSTLVTIRRGDATHHILYDTGISPTGVIANLDRLGADARDISAIVCSHGHFDHTMGLNGIAHRVGPVNLPVLIHPHFWRQRRVAAPGADPIDLPTTSKRGLEQAGFDVIENRQPSFLLDRSVLVTGEVDRTTGFEKGFAAHQAFLATQWEPDPMILDDQALIVHVRDKGLVILTGCGHSGLINIIRYARRLTGVEKVHLVMGGFHLNGPAFEPVIPDTIAALTDIAPAYVMPAHCTGWRATQAIATSFPASFIPSSVGTIVRITAHD